MDQKQKELIKIENLSKYFGDKKILDNISFEIKKGEILALLAKSGGGKSTLIKILVGYYTADNGAIYLNGKDIQESGIKSIVGYTTQDNSFYDKLTVYENMRYYANLYNVSNKSRIDSLLRDVKLYDNRHLLSSEISGGMKRRLDFAISLIHSPKFIILDEPTTGLDPFLVNNFWEIVAGIVEKEKISVLVTTHILSEVKQHCDRAVILKLGKVSKIIDLSSSIDVEKEFMKYA